MDVVCVIDEELEGGGVRRDEGVRGGGERGEPWDCVCVFFTSPHVNTSAARTSAMEAAAGRA